MTLCIQPTSHIFPTMKGIHDDFTTDQEVSRRMSLNRLKTRGGCLSMCVLVAVPQARWQHSVKCIS